MHWNNHPNALGSQTTISNSDLQNHSIIFCPNKDGLQMSTQVPLLSFMHCAQSAIVASQAECQHSRHSSVGSPPGTGEGVGLGGGLGDGVGDGVGAGVGPKLICHWNGKAGKPSALKSAH